MRPLSLLLLTFTFPNVAGYSHCRQSRQFKAPSRMFAGCNLGEPKKRSRDSCETDDVEYDRREVVFSTLGTVLASMIGRPAASDAVYGTDANIELPNVLEGITKRATEECLVESLGNRECLLYMDPANKLFQGFDSKVLLERLESSSQALATIPNLIVAKKWSAVNGVLTGPMGTLVSTMNELTKLSGNPDHAGELAKATKLDIIAISQAADRKQADKALAFHRKATDHLAEFVKGL
mmetsp:Transcript_4165/g.7172  ORF Transcript_4165/g.7172 Transcript_4165/m.7172 type:complete len:237 (-) Transcript_4165:1477-2187(-)